MLVQPPNGRFEAMDHVTPSIGIETLVVDTGDAKGDPNVTGLGHKGAIVDEAPNGEQPVDAAGSLVVLQDAREGLPRPHLDIEAAVLKGVVPRSEPRRREQDPKHVGIAFRGTACEEV